MARTEPQARRQLSPDGVPTEAFHTLNLPPTQTPARSSKPTNQQRGEGKKTALPWGAEPKPTNPGGRRFLFKMFYSQ
ncbi:hypothetical protein AZI85_16240 [Bdellovibrio bacteriovorus]|uniref:Uncharacterized protein n=1 Tax=Bdellovibrio bacteriovorus TaxID=959 RepID=A0A150WTB6_BDEBC|nr:hypothetical protein AZI85_16240 [Bdellovibrio bacteriovorus]